MSCGAGWARMHDHQCPEDSLDPLAPEACRQPLTLSARGNIPHVRRAPLLQRSFRSCRELRLNLRPSTRCVQLAKSLVWLCVTCVEPLVDRERPGTDGILLAY